MIKKMTVGIRTIGKNTGSPNTSKAARVCVS